MRKRNGCKGSTPVAAAFAVVLVALTVITTYLFVAKPWWFPPAITDVGNEIDAQFMRTLWITGIIFILAQLGLAWVIFRYRAAAAASVPAILKATLAWKSSGPSRR